MSSPDRPPDDGHGLAVVDLRRRFGDVVALDGVSLRVRPGEIHGFVGANGAGKTTTMRIVVGVERADAGVVSMDGRSIDADARRQLGYLPEERGLYPDMRVGDQVRYLARLHGLTAETAADRADELLTRLGLAERVDDATGELSLGNQQRVQLAAALAHRPRLLLLDEPFSGLDPVATDVMASMLREEADRGVPVLFSSHQLELVERLCDQVTIIAEGRNVTSGGIEALRRERSGRRLGIELTDVTGPLPDWHAQPGVIDVDGDARSPVLQLTDDADDQHLLDLARAHGRVQRFAPVRPSLAELYREVAR